MGVDAFRDNAFIVKARIKTRPIQQWNVGREFNRRMKLRFDEMGISIPLPHRIVEFRPDASAGQPMATPEAGALQLSRTR
jgi:small conductance mechanosensitive channel